MIMTMSFPSKWVELFYQKSHESGKEINSIIHTFLIVDSFLMIIDIISIFSSVALHPYLRRHDQLGVLVPWAVHME